MCHGFAYGSQIGNLLVQVRQAVALALKHEPVGGFAAFNIMADRGLTSQDVSSLNADLAGMLNRRWGGTTDLVREHGLNLDDLVWGRLLFPVDKAKNNLGYRPRYDFAAFLEACRRGDRSHYPFADETWWGAERPAR